MKAYLHDDEEDECDEDVDLGVFPGVVVADVVKLLCHALTAPRAVVEQRDQRLMLRQLTGQHKEKKSSLSVFYIMSHKDSLNDSIIGASVLSWGNKALNGVQPYLSSLHCEDTQFKLIISTRHFGCNLLLKFLIFQSK